MKTITYECAVKFVVEIPDEFGDESDIEQMKDDLENYICHVGEVEFGRVMVKQLEIAHVK